MAESEFSSSHPTILAATPSHSKSAHGVSVMGLHKPQVGPTEAEKVHLWEEYNSGPSTPSAPAASGRLQPGCLSWGVGWGMLSRGLAVHTGSSKLERHRQVDLGIWSPGPAVGGGRRQKDQCGFKVPSTPAPQGKSRSAGRQRVLAMTGMQLEKQGGPRCWVGGSTEKRTGVGRAGWPLPGRDAEALEGFRAGEGKEWEVLVAQGFQQAGVTCAVS